MTRKFVLRHDQIREMAKAAEPSFEDSVAKHVRDNHGDSVTALNDDELKRRTTIGIGQARAHGLDTQASITGFVSLMFVIAPNFYEYPVANQVLHDTTIPADARLGHMAQRMTIDDWAAVTKSSNGKIWELK